MLGLWGVREILINLHFHPSPICDYIKRHHPPDIKIAFSFEPEILGTGGVLRRAAWFLDQSPFWMINADIAATLNPLPLIREFSTRKTLAAVWMEPRRGPRTVEVKNGNIVNFQSSRPGTEGTYTFCGLHLISPALLRFIPDESFSSIIGAYQSALKSGWRIRGVCVEKSYWSDLGTPESYLKAHAELHGRHRDQCILKLQKKGVIIRGFASIDRTATITPGAKIENSVIWRKAMIGPRAVIQNAIVGSECVVNSRVRRLAVKPLLHESHHDLQLNTALNNLKVKTEKTAIIPFEPRGSARSFTRITAGGKSFIMIRYSRERHENCLYAEHGRFLARLGLNVPKIILDRPEKQLLVIEDLGDNSLQKIATECSHAELMEYYRNALESIVLLHQSGARRAKKEHLSLTAPFSPDLYHWEREFFGRNFLERHLDLRQPEIRRIMTELKKVGHALNREPMALIHRDLQSSNIIFSGKKPFFIDFQGMRLGPAAYDLASLLCDPYINLSLPEQEFLLDFYNFILCATSNVKSGPSADGQPPCAERPAHLNMRFKRWPSTSGRRAETTLQFPGLKTAGKCRTISRRIFWLTAVQRLCQALGAYGRLGANAETKWFSQYIPPGVAMLRRALKQSGACQRLAKILMPTRSDHGT